LQHRNRAGFALPEPGDFGGRSATHRRGGLSQLNWATS
jgi:hypothetical protein